MKRLLGCAGVLVALTLTGCARVTPGAAQAGGPASGPRSADFPSDLPSDTPAPPPPSSAVPTPAAPTRRQREERLNAQTSGEQHVLVKTANGYQAAAFDQHANIQFWRNVGNTVAWSRIGVSTYPYSPSIGGPADASLTGALLTGMRDATFIVTGTFTGDSSGNAVAFTTGARGWGVIKAEPNGNIGPSGQPVGADRIGLSFGFAFAGGDLVTEDCRTDQPIAMCGDNPVIKRWRWTGSDFARV